MRGLVALTLLTVAACADARAGAGGVSPGPSAPPATGSPSRAWELAPAPASLGAVPAAGTFTFRDGDALWRYVGASGALAPASPDPSAVPSGALAWDGDRRSGTLASVDAAHRLRVAGGDPLPDVAVAGAHWSPDGAFLALEVPTQGDLDGPPARWLPAELRVLDRRAGTAVTVYRAADADLSAYARGVPAWAHESFSFAGWSPDSRFLALWRIDTFSGSIDQDGRPLVLVDRLGRIAPVSLGTTLLDHDWLAWRPPHTLAYVEGGSRMTTSGKRVRVWSPESGVQAVTAADESGVGPVWAADGSLWFTAGPSGDYDPSPFFGGHGVGARRLYRVELASGTRELLPAAAGYVQHAVRPSADGRAHLEVRQPIPADGGLDLAGCELWYVDASTARALVRLRHPCSYDDAYTSLVGVDWDR